MCISPDSESSHLPENTREDGFFFDTSSTTNSGLWYSTIDDVYLEGFAGNAVHVKGHSNDFSSLTQWVLFNNVVAFRTAGGGNALKLEGGVFQLRFRNCEFDGQAIGDGTDIYIGGYGSGVGGYPVSIVFEGLVAQAAATAVQLDGAANITFYNSHHEKLWGAYHITNKAGIGVHGLVITDSYFSGDVGINGGAGYELKIDTTIASGIVFAHNQMFGNPDGTVLSTNLASVVYQDNLYAGALNAPPTSGITTQLTPASTLNTLSVHSIGLNPSATPIVTIQSGLGPGEMVHILHFRGFRHVRRWRKYRLDGSNLDQRERLDYFHSQRFGRLILEARVSMDSVESAARDPRRYSETPDKT